MGFDPTQMRAREADGVSADLNTLSERVIGAAMHVHSALGPGLRETFYERALVMELTARGIKSERQVPFAVEYRGQLLGEQCVDLVVESRIIVECKGVAAIADGDHAQLLGYLRFTGLPLGLLMNFHAARLKDGLVRKISTQVQTGCGELTLRRPPGFSANSARPLRTL